MLDRISGETVPTRRVAVWIVSRSSTVGLHGCRAVGSRCSGRQRSAGTQHSSYSGSCPVCCHRCDDIQHCSPRTHPRLQNDAFLNALFIFPTTVYILVRFCRETLCKLRQFCLSVWALWRKISNCTKWVASEISKPWGKSPSGVQGQAPLGGLGDEISQKLKLYRAIHVVQARYCHCKLSVYLWRWCTVVLAVWLVVHVVRK